MKILVDNKIPYIREAILHISQDVEYLAAKDFTSESVKEADVLIIRTRTKCTPELLEGSKVKFIATATIGFDHIDTDYCAHKGIIWRNAPGCNSNSVRQYIQSVFILLKENFLSTLIGKTIGVVGVGHVGSKVADLAQSYGMKVLLNDPIRAELESDFMHTPLDEIAEKADIITFHTPLVRDGKYSTYHLADGKFFSKLKKQPILINSSRGEVIDTDCLKNHLLDKTISQAIMDVWEHEPNIDKELLELVYLGTPHIAGYSADGKAKATEMALQSVSDFFNLGLEVHISAPSPKEDVISADNEDDALLQIYNPQLDSIMLKDDSSNFEYLRSHYALRRESLAYDIRIQK